MIRSVSGTVLALSFNIIGSQSAASLNIVLSQLKHDTVEIGSRVEVRVAQNVTGDPLASVYAVHPTSICTDPIKGFLHCSLGINDGGQTGDVAEVALKVSNHVSV